MDILEVRKEIKGVLNILKPDEKTINDIDRTIEEDFAYLRQIAQYIMFDKEASCRESYELGKSQGGK